MKEYNTRFADLQTLRDSWYADFISGAKDIDAEWDNFVKTVNEGGGDIVQAEVQAAYIKQVEEFDAFKEIWERDFAR